MHIARNYLEEYLPNLYCLSDATERVKREDLEEVLLRQGTDDTPKNPLFLNPL